MNSPALHAKQGTFRAHLDARSKIVASLLLVVALVVSDSLVLKSAIVVGAVTMWIVGGIGLRALGLAVLSLWIFVVATMIARSVIRASDAADAISLGAFSFSPAGALDGAQMCAQIAGILLVLGLLVRSTPSLALAEGGEALLKPLQRFGLSAHNAVMMFAIALRFLPLMNTEFTRLQMAQISRGAGVERESVLLRIRGVLPLLIPLVLVTLVRAKELAEAMESRGYRGHTGRSPIHEARFERKDQVVLAVAVLAVIAAVITRFLWR